MSKRILALDVGASTIKLAEFTQYHDHALELLNYGVKSLGIGPNDEGSRMLYVSTAVSELMNELRIKPGPVLLSVSGQHVFSRYVKLPPVSGDKIGQIIEYEAKQNVPYPLEEVVWDRQILHSDSEDLDVLLAAIKLDLLEGLAENVTDCGLEPELVDISAAAILNAVAYNYPDEEGCTLVLDMGGRSTNLIFLEGARVFSRSVPVSGHTITQQIARDFEVDFLEAEEMKESVSMVALGGAYEPLEDAEADRVTKCIRGVMTRLHADINRSVTHYRSQQNGSPPSRVLLTGGSSIMSYLDTFLEEKLRIPVAYVNPVQNVSVNESISEDRIAQDLHLLSEVVGLALRKVGTCPIELNLLPPSITRERTFRKKQGVLVASLLTIAATLGCWAWIGSAKVASAETELEMLQANVKSLEQWTRELKGIKEEGAKQERKVAALALAVGRRGAWAEVVQAVRDPVPEGVWISQIRPGETSNTLAVVGTFFQDDVYEDISKPDNTPIYKYRNDLAASPFFTEARFARSTTPLSTDAKAGGKRYLSAFMIEVVLKDSLPQ